MPHCAKCGGWISALVYECPACGEKPKGPVPQGLVPSEISGSMGATERAPRSAPAPHRPVQTTVPVQPPPTAPPPPVEPPTEPPPRPSSQPIVPAEPFAKAPGPSTETPKPLAERPDLRPPVAPRQAVPRPATRPGMPARRTPVRPELAADEDEASDEPEPRGEQTPDDRASD